MEYITSHKGNGIYKFLVEYGGNFVIRSLNPDRYLFDENYTPSEYRKQTLLEDQEHFVSVCKKFIEWFSIENLTDNSYYDEHDPYLGYVHIDYIKTKTFYDSINFPSDVIDIKHILCLNGTIKNSLDRSIIEIQLYNNDIMLDSPLLTDEYKRHYNLLLDIFEHCLLAKNMLLYNEIDGIVKFPIAE